MSGIGLVAYLSRELDEKSKDVPTIRVDRNADKWQQHCESYVSSFKKVKNTIKLKKRRNITSFSKTINYIFVLAILKIIMVSLCSQKTLFL